MFHVTFTQDSGKYRKGDHVEDAAEVARILASEQEAHVVKVPADTPEPAAPAAPAPAPAAPTTKPKASSEEK